MRKSNSYMNQDREKKAKMSLRLERFMGLFFVSNKKTVVFSPFTLICLQKSVFSPPPSVIVSLACLVCNLCRICNVTTLHMVQSKRLGR